jgi:hypothetical protein
MPSYKIAIMTPAFDTFNMGYSLTGIILDQARVLTEHGHEVEIWCNQQCDDSCPVPIPVKKIIPFSHLIDYRNLAELLTPATPSPGKIIHPETDAVIDNPFHSQVAKRMCQVFEDNLAGIDFVFTHDIVFTGWNLPYYLGMQEYALKHRADDSVKWLHWVHSYPVQNYDWWHLENLGDAHRLIYPTEAGRQAVADAWGTHREMTRNIPHFKDIRKVHRFLPESWEYTQDNPQLLSADVLQVYPASVDRLESKRLKEMIYLFAGMKKLDVSVCLVVANQWATGRKQKEDVLEYKELALQEGLTLKEILFTSDYRQDWEVGVPWDIVMDLLKLSNLFVFPTISESFGLALAEAILAGGVLPVLNLDLEGLSEITGGRGLKFSFGSIRRDITYTDQKGYFQAMAAVILQRIFDEESVAAKTNLRQSLNYNRVYTHHYLPIMAEAKHRW